MKKLLIIILIQFSLLGLAQEKMPGIIAEDLDGLEVLNSREFNGSALWGYINGGADLYLEYGFNFLRVENLKLEKQEFTVNIYQMKDAAAAFGIFSVSWFNCSGKFPEHYISCITPYQVQFVKAQYYISIINETGNSEAREIGLKLARILSAKIEGNNFEIPVVFQKKEFEGIHGQAKFMKGRLGVENGFPAWSKYFENLENFEVYMFGLKKDESKTYIAKIRLEDKTQIVQLCKNLDFNSQSSADGMEIYSADKKKCLLPISENSFVFFESVNAPEQISSYLRLFNN